MEAAFGLLVCLVLGASVEAYPSVVVDLSHWNGNVNLAKAKLEGGLVGVILKATQGSKYVDPTYQSRRQEAERAGLLWGAYHFGVGGVSGKEQAIHFLSQFRPGEDTRGVLVALDLEQNPRGKDMSMAEAEEFVETVKGALGRYPVLYGGPYFLSSYSKSRVLTRCPLWVSHYTSRQEPSLPKGWNSWILWQYTNGAVGGNPRTVAGVGACDRNFFNGTQEQLKKSWPF